MFSRNHSKNTLSTLASNPSYAEKVKTKDVNDFVTKKGKEEVVVAVVQTTTNAQKVFLVLPHFEARKTESMGD